ncbi:MAG: diguanylate cyclase [Coriobacteriia bacterium]|nr:diguanylate cyclase [Coriobacteriia bacterium]
MGSTAPHSGDEPLISHSKDECVECWGCVRVCPVRAIRVVGGRSEVVQEKCVACGLCVSECGRGGHVVRDDTPAVRELLRSRRSVVALLASEFTAALHPMTAPQIERALGALGFCSVETTLLGEEIVAEAYEKMHLRDGSLISMRSTCPVAVDFVRKYYPALVGALAPIVPPYIAQARLIRDAYAGDVAIVYVSPCFARKDEYRDPQFGDAVDAVIDFLELKRMIEDTAEPYAQGHVTMPTVCRPSVLKEISLTDGFPKQTLMSRDMTDASVKVVRGIDDLDRTLRALVAGEAGPTIIDMLNCEGCIDGPAVSPSLSLFAKRNIEAAARHVPGATRVGTRAMLAVLPQIDTVRSFKAAPVKVPVPTAEMIDEILASGRIVREEAPDCGACGWSTCVEHALAIFGAESSWDLCLPLQRALCAEQSSQLDEQKAALADAQMLDPITGLWNRRAFAERLEMELARHLRYGSPLALVLVDIDRFAEINNAFTSDAGDMVLALAAVRIASVLRKTDAAARWVGDQFAVLLPGISKTAAFAVAEKLRETIKAAPCPVEVAGYTGDVSITASLGVVAASPEVRDVQGLLEAADAALHEAMGAGMDRVHLAPG